MGISRAIELFLLLNRVRDKIVKWRTDYRRRAMECAARDNDTIMRLALDAITIAPLKNTL